MTAQERQAKEEKLNELKKEMADVHGTKCEVYSRVVGYLRPVQGWNILKTMKMTLIRALQDQFQDDF